MYKVTKMTIISIMLYIFLLGCAHQPPKIYEVINITNTWWGSIKNKDPHYYEIINAGIITFHLCGSRTQLWIEYNKEYPETPFDLSSNTYMFTTYNGHLVHMWLIVKIVNRKVVFHKWAAGHELVRVLHCFSTSILNADNY